MPALLSSGGLVVIQKSKLVLETMVLDTEEQSTNNRKLIIGCVTLSREVSKTSHFLFEIINYCYTFRETIKRLNMKNSTITLKMAGLSNVQEVYYPLALIMGYRVVERHLEMA